MYNINLRNISQVLVFFGVFSLVIAIQIVILKPQTKCTALPLTSVNKYLKICLFTNYTSFCIFFF